MAYEVDRAPAEWVTEQVRRRSRAIWLMIAATTLLVALMVYLGIFRHHIVLEMFLLVVVIAIGRTAHARMDVFPRWRRGAEAEASVGERLNQLRGTGFIVMHDITQPQEGNVDHLVSGPSGVFMIETKLRRYEEPQLKKAKRQAAKLGNRLGVWVTPVICIAERKHGKPFKTNGVWIVRRDDLLDWLPSQRNPVLPFERLAQFADSCA